MTAPRGVWLLIAVTVLAGCTGLRASTSPSRSTEPPPTSIGSLNAAPDRGCTVKVDGAVSGSIHAPDGPATAGSDYWLSPAERAAAGGGQLTINCTDSLGSISLASIEGVQDSRVPFAPAHYTVGAPTDPVMVVAVIANQPYAARSGSFLIDRFDSQNLDGSFDLELVASHNAASVHAHGTFALSCQGLTRCQG